MKKFNICLIIITAILANSLCSKSSFNTALVGSWEWSGDGCDEQGACKKDIITDEESRDTFTEEGLFLSKNSRNKYALKGDTIYFASEHNSYDTRYAEIASIRGDVMLLKFKNGIRKYGRVKKH
ncbi:MAG: hypothetical protein A2W19_00580 [Spirochaetes bacterium RBG_16_49_21]|nr:MAG: hypothetical protein A2W19_00580 [Spirochaetes bacterium RBG_16_49_21]